MRWRSPKVGAMAAGFATELWTLPRLAALIKGRFGTALATGGVPDAAAAGLECPTAAWVQVNAKASPQTYSGDAG
jgi:hypothetical protein